MKIPEYSYMAECNKVGIRIYPILKHGSYYLVLEFNRTSEFEAHEIISTKTGDIRYDPKKEVYCEKILELYEHLYKTKVMPKSQAA